MFIFVIFATAAALLSVPFARAQCDSIVVAKPAAVASSIYALKNFDPDGPGPAPELLIAGGEMALDTGSPDKFIAAYDGATWHTIGGALNGRVWAFQTGHDKLYVRGGRVLALIPETPLPAPLPKTFALYTFDGPEWTVQPGFISIPRDTAPPGLISYQNLLYAFGTFSQINGVAVGNIARFDDVSWASPDAGIPTPIASAAVGPDGLYLGALRAYTDPAVPAPSFALVYRLQRQSACLADANCDGGVDGGDVERFFTLWEASSVAADFNADGGIDRSDVEAFFILWEAGC